MKLLVIRLSAMGDVALSVPVIKAMSVQHKNAEITLVTNKLYNVFFEKIENIRFINPDLKDKHKGFFGLLALYKEIKKDVSPDVIIDIHNVLRSKILRFFFKLSGIKTAKINKGRNEKRKLTRKRNKNLLPLKHTTDRYAETFIKAGFSLELKHSENSGFNSINEEITKLIHDKNKKIGIAPFAKHLQKQYPFEKTEALIQKLSENGFHIFLFGGGEKEKLTAESLVKKYKNIRSVIGKLSLKHEIELIDKLDIMISPDSANMHIAALTSVKIISIWGATHPFAGFTPFVPPERHHVIQNEVLSCRPCSVFGNKTCYKKTLECLHSVEPDEIYSTCKKLID